MKYMIKTFAERTWAEKPEGGAPHEWNFIPRDVTGEVPIDEQVNQWSEETGAKIVQVSPPGVHHYWLNPELTSKCITIGVTVTYLKGQDEDDNSTADAPSARLAEPRADTGSDGDASQSAGAPTSQSPVSPAP